MKHGIIYNVNDGPYRYQAWPTVTIDENGVLYAVWSGRRVSHIDPFGVNMMSVSRDGGDTWSAPAIINDTWLDDRDGGICCLGKGKMIASWFNHPTGSYLNNYLDRILRETNEYIYGMVKGMMDAYPHFTEEMNRYGSFVRISKDHGTTWGEAIQVPVSAPHGPVFTKSGRLLYLGKAFQSDNDEDNSAGEIKLYESFDEGESWEYLSTLPTPEGLITEPYVTELPDGRLVGALRVNTKPNYTMALCISEDGGKTWDGPIPTDISGSPPHFCVLSDGSVVLSYGRREKPMGIRAVISKDGFKTWSDEILITDEIISATRGDLGYPSTVELPDGKLLTVYYRPVGNGDICSIAYTKWDKPQL